jgi:hypothetical protein
MTKPGISGAPHPPTFTCPACGAVSHNINDLVNGYCARCHAFTAEPFDPQGDGEFSVVQFFANDTYEYALRFVDAEEAIETAARLTHSVAVQTGMVRRVIITDGGDHTNFEWKFGEDITYPEGFARSCSR